MKKMKNKIICLLLVVLLIGVNVDHSIYSVNAANETNQIQQINKDETVYINLNHDGSILNMNVVNYIQTPQNGIYEDFGNYSEVKNLSGDKTPVISEDSVSWDLPQAMEGFYYQGTLKSGELPWNFNISYELDGKIVDAKALSGATGKLTLHIKADQNPLSQEFFRKNYMMQITVPLNMQNTTLICAPGAVQMIAGQTKNLNFTVLPNTSGDFAIEANVNDFSMAAMDITMMKADMTGLIDTQEMTDGFDQMSGGMEDLTDGTVKLKDGLSQLSDGIGQIADGMNELSKGTPQLSAGMDQFGKGLNTFGSNLTEVSKGSAAMNQGLKQLAQNGSKLTSGYQDLETGITSMLSMKKELSALATAMMQSGDPQTVQLAQAVLGQLQGLEGLQSGLDQLNQNLDGYMQGVKQTSKQYEKFNAGMQQLPGGFEQVSGGYNAIANGNKQVYSAVGKLSNGLSELDHSAAEIPGKTQQLIDGQEQMKDGVDQAVTEIKDLTGTSKDPAGVTVVSFAAPGKVTPDSVQFILRTAAIEKIDQQENTIPVQVEKEGFWKRLLDLFR